MIGASSGNQLGTLGGRLFERFKISGLCPDAAALPQRPFGLVQVHAHAVAPDRVGGQRLVRLPAKSDTGSEVEHRRRYRGPNHACADGIL